MSREVRMKIKSGTPEKPLFAGQYGSATAHWWDGERRLTPDIYNAVWLFQMTSSPFSATITGHYSWHPGWAVPNPLLRSGHYSIEWTSLLRGVSKDGTIRGYVQASKVVAWVHTQADPCRWELLDGPNRGGVTGDGREPTHWLEGYGPEEKPGRKALMRGIDLPSFRWGRDVSMKANFALGGIVDRLLFEETQVIEFGGKVGLGDLVGNRLGNGVHIQPDIREKEGPHTTAKQSREEFGDALFIALGGYRNTIDTTLIYEYKELPDNQGFELLANPPYFHAVDDAGEPVLSDWLIRWKVRWIDNHLRCDWEIWHEGDPRYVIEVMGHVFLRAELFQNGYAYMDGGREKAAAWPTNELMFPIYVTGSHLVDRVWHGNWVTHPEAPNQYDQDENPGEQALNLHFRVRDPVHRIVPANEKFRGHLYVSQSLEAAIQLYEGGEVVPEEPVRKVKILDENEDEFLVSQNQFERAFPFLTLHHRDFLGNSIMQYVGTQEEFENRFPIVLEPEEPEEPEEPGEPEVEFVRWPSTNAGDKRLNALYEGLKMIWEKLHE